jgi:hypothetical protein
VGIRDRVPAPTIRQFANRDFLPFCRSTFAAKAKTLSYYENGAALLLEYPAVADESLDTISLEALGICSSLWVDPSHRIEYRDCPVSVDTHERILRRAKRMEI